MNLCIINTINYKPGKFFHFTPKFSTFSSFILADQKIIFHLGKQIKNERV